MCKKSPLERDEGGLQYMKRRAGIWNPAIYRIGGNQKKLEKKIQYDAWKPVRKKAPRITHRRMHNCSPSKKNNAYREFWITGSFGQ